MHDTGPLAHRPVVDVAALDVAGLAAAEGQVDELAQAEEEVRADRKTAALQFKAVIEKLLRVVELRQAQVIAEAVDQCKADGAAGNARKLSHIQLRAKPQLPRVGCGVPASTREVADGFVTERQADIDALLLEPGPAEIAEQIRSGPEIVSRIRNRRRFRRK